MAKKSRSSGGWPILEVWEKYENIAMHFNDLLLKLRLQALAGVATLSTVVGIFAKSGSDSASRGIWLLAALTIFGLSLVWVAIWVIDFRYYNRLLGGAVVALKNIEIQSRTRTRIKIIELSSLIENSVIGNGGVKAANGVTAFYLLVLVTLLGGCLYCLHEHVTAKALDVPAL